MHLVGNELHIVGLILARDDPHDGRPGVPRLDRVVDVGALGRARRKGQFVDNEGYRSYDRNLCMTSDERVAYS